jgi:Double zinc ribbon
MPAGIFGIENEGLNLAASLVLLFLVVVWLALIVWTYFDARRRLDDPVLVGTATAASLFPFVGTIIYTILRPPEFAEERRERLLEMRAAELRVRQLEEQSCPNCGFPVERTYLRCPSCRARVKDPCQACGKPIDPRWAICPYCETPTRTEIPERRVATGASARARAAERRATRQPRPARQAKSGRQAAPTTSRQNVTRAARSTSQNASQNATPPRGPSPRPARTARSTPRETRE